MSAAAIDRNLANTNIPKEFAGPPFELLANWRENDPVHWNPAPSPDDYRPAQPASSLSKGFWVLTKYKDVASVSRDSQLFCSHVGTSVIWEYELQRLAEIQSGLAAMAPAQHAQIKRIMQAPFTNKAIEAFAPEIVQVTREIIDSVASAGRCEFVFDVASKLPVYTFCALVGVPPEDRDMIFNLGNGAADIEREVTREDDPFTKLFEYSAKLAEMKRKEPDGLMMSSIVHGELDGHKLTPDQIGMFFVTMAIAGHETTRGTAAHFIRLMNEYPDQYAILRSDPERFIPNAIEEVLRFAPPLLNFRRTATRDTVIGNQSIRAGDKIYMSYPAANRDPEVFEDPDRFDILRSNAAKHLSFGFGPHTCIGARLARVQLRFLIEQIVKRIPDIRLSRDPGYLPSIWMNAIIDMPVEFTPESGG